MDQGKNQLQGNSIGLLGAATMGVVALSPAMGLIGCFGPTFLTAGKAAPLVFVLALLATIPTAISYALLSRDYPTSGSAAAWSARAIGDQVGTWVGWIVFLYYLTNFIIQPVTAGVFLGDFVAALNGKHQFLVYLVGALLCIVWPAWIVYRGIKLSSKSALGFLLFESAVVVALCATIVIGVQASGTQMTLEGFHFRASPTGSAGLFQAMVFAILAYCGFDVVSTLSEETKMAKKLIPQATLLCLVIYAVLMTVGVWCLTFGGTPEHLNQLAQAGEMPINDVARVFWHRGSLLIPLTAVSAALGLSVACAVGASRILFSMGRDGLAHRTFGDLNSKFGVPWKALHLIFVIGLIGAVLAGAALGPYQAYVWWGTTITFFAMITYLLVNLSSLLLNYSRIFKSLSGFVLYGAIPVFGIAADGYILIRSFFIELWHQGWATGQSIIVFDVGCAVLALIPVWKKRQQLLRERTALDHELELC